MAIGPEPFGLRLATLRDVPTIQAIELEATALFDPEYPEMAAFFRAHPTSAGCYERAVGDRSLWVAEQGGVLVGFALGHVVDGAGHLDELDVLPAFGRRGIGRALVEQVCRWAADLGLPALTLSTLPEVPWNAPFYRKLGFRVLDEVALTPGLAAIRERELAFSLCQERVMMRRELGAPAALLGVLRAQDPNEPFDVLDADGRPLGRVKARGAVHRDGDWHRSMHLWVVSRPERAVLLQRRGRHKDTWPLRLDVAVAGHYRAGEGLAEVLREAEEEVGLVVGPADVVHLGTRIRADDGARGIRDNEIQDILAYVTDGPLTDLRPSPDELEELLLAPLDELVRLFEDPKATARGLHLDGESAGTRLSAAHFVPCPDGYWTVALRALIERVGGRPTPPFRLGGSTAC